MCAVEQGALFDTSVLLAGMSLAYKVPLLGTLSLENAIKLKFENRPINKRARVDQREASKTGVT